MKSKVAQPIAAALEASQDCNAHRQKAVGMIAARHAQEQAQNSALKFARRNANAAELRGLSALKDTNADCQEK